MAITYLEAIDAISERQRSVAVAALKVAQSTQLASLRATRSFTYLALSSPLFAVRFFTQLATALTIGLLEQQVVQTKVLKPPSKASVAPNAALVTTADDAAQSAARTTSADTAKALAMAADNAVQAAARKAIDDTAKIASTDFAPALVTTADEDQEIQLRAERLVITKQRVQHGEARVRKEIGTEMKSIDVPVSHEELVIDRYAVTGGVDVDGEPIAETIRIPLTEDKVNITKETVVREEVEVGKSRVDHVEHIRDTVRHEELRVDDATANPGTSRVNPEKLGTTADDASPVPVMMRGSTTTSAENEQAILHERVQERAYALWEVEGRPEGRQLEDWTQAEREIYAMPTPATAILA